jgi:hypothetical protein
MRIQRTLTAGLAVAAVLAAAAPAPAGQTSVSKARKATAKFHRLATAKKDGYGVLRDAQGISCIDNPGVGGMGIHYVKGALVGDGKVDLLHPEAVIYDPQANGRRKLVAVEYVVFQKDWDPNHSSPPRLYGRGFELVKEGNRYGLPPFYELHAWLWKKNPRGMFDDWNPRVSC